MSITAPGRRAAAIAGPRFTPVELARMLRLPPPTAEQAEVISAPVAPLLVVAGAGSGKTETMAGRVVWLVANGYVSPDQVLGLTFTRKAAGELAHRVRTRLGQLIRRLGQDELLEGEPTVATYHAYAGRIVAEHGVRGGFEPTTRLLTEASCWQLADALVRRYDGDMSAVSSAPSTVTDAVLHLAAELAEHLVDVDRLAEWTAGFSAEVQRRGGEPFQPVREALQRQQARLALLPLVRGYAAAKAELEAMDFADQLSRAARVAIDHPEVGTIERSRFGVVLLDEYQDTSYAQVRLLRALFGGGHPVTAVGDPCQSIYGWRGASAGALDRFPAEFTTLSGGPAQVLSLATSWRNRPEILRIANTLSQPLRDFGHRVTRLTPAQRVAPRAGAATVHCALLSTYAEEAGWIATRIVQAWGHAAGRPGAAVSEIPVAARPTTAVLIRTRAQIPALESALRAAGLPVDVVGLGGLLDTAEVRDVVSTLRVLADPLDGAAMIRLLTGARWRIGPRDLVALYRRARALAAAHREAHEDASVVPDRLDEASLAEALDDLGAAQGYSEAGYRRLHAYAAELRRLRYRVDLPLPDLIAEIERVTGLAVEVAVRSRDGGLARAHLDAFAEVAARFIGESDGGSLTAFLAFLEAAEAEERGLPAGEVDIVEGAVQILTGHAAKGLEWDLVSVAGLCAGVFPGPVKASDHYLGGQGVLPFPLRGDRAGLPALDLGTANDRRGVRDAFDAFDVGWRAHDEREERRLAYVAVTRPRRLLLCSGYWWGEGTKRPRGPSGFLTEIRDACLAGAGLVETWTEPPQPAATNPTSEVVAQASWPGDPLGARREAMQRAAALVRQARAELERGGAPVGPGGSLTAAVPDDPLAVEWAYEVEVLLAERARLAHDPQAPIDVRLPDHLSVSALVSLRRDPQGLARALRRPLPARPDPHTRRGTAFHAWLEHRFGAQELLDLDELPGASDEDAAPDGRLMELQQQFLASSWADRAPIRVEVGFATMIEGVVVRGRMDAVYANPDGSFEVVDWKTGQRPTGAAAQAAAVQLAVYRLAWAQLAQVPVSQVSAAFFYVAHGETVRPADLLDEVGLRRMIAAVPQSG